MSEPKIVISPDDVLTELSGTGMCQYLAALGDEITQKKVLTRRIFEAQQYLENVLETFFFQTRVATRPVTPGMVRGVDYDVEEDGYPYTRADFATYGTIQLRRRPVVTIKRAGIRYGNDQNYLAVMDYPQGWINQQARLGILHVQAVVGAGSMQSTGSGSLLLLPMIQTGFHRGETMPLIFSVEYTAGYLPADFDPETDSLATACPDYSIHDLARAVRYHATANMLRSMRRSVGAGGGSIAMDGLSQSWDSNRFSAEIEDYENQVETIISDHRAFEAPPMVFFA